MDSAPPIDDSARPIPPRYWWARRVGVVVALFLLALGGLNYGQSCRIEQRLADRVAAIRALGEPILADDFAADHVSSDEDAAPLLMRAAMGIVASVPRPATAPADAPDVDEAEPGAYVVASRTWTPDLSDYCSDRALVRERLDDVAFLLRENGPALELLDQACERPRADWRIGLTSPMLNVRLPYLTPVRHLARLAGTRAMYASETGDHATTVRSISQTLTLTNYLSERPAHFITALVAIAVQSMTASVIEQTAPDLDVGDAPPAADRGDVQALIAALLDERAIRRALREGLYTERAMQLDTVRGIADGTSPGLAAAPLLSTPMRWLFRPMALSTGVRLIDHTTAYGIAIEAESYPAVCSRVPEPPEKGADMLGLVSQLSPSYDRGTRLFYRSLAERRMASVALAIRLYVVDHGVRPATLEALVPDYLPFVPRDPFAADDRPLGYLPAADPPRLYSVGENETDEGGAYMLRGDGGLAWGAYDIPFFLDGPPADPD